jgi:hypothetical protein
MSGTPEKIKTGRKPLADGEKLKVVPVRLNDTQKATLQIIGQPALRDWLDREGRKLARAGK